MKKIFVLLIIIPFIFIGCNNTPHILTILIDRDISKEYSTLNKKIQKELRRGDSLLILENKIIEDEIALRNGEYENVYRPGDDQ